jgi:4-amino-4-deoxy-L-arabinose transferase-like glycosyltransferase
VGKDWPQSEQRKLLAGIPILFCLSLFVFFICQDRSIALYDEGIILAGSDRVSTGAVLHRDFYFNYGPAQLYILSVLFKIFSPTVWVERSWDAFVKSVVVVLVFVIVAQLRSERAAWLASIASLIWLAHFGSYGYPVFPTLAAVLGSVVCLLPVLERSQYTSWLVAAGACIGVAALFRYDVGVFAFAAEAIILIAYLLSKNQETGRKRRDVTRAILTFSAGLALVAIPVVAAYIVSGAAGDFLFDVVSFPAQSYVAMRSLPFPGFATLRATPSEASVYLPLVVVAAILPALFDALRRRKERTTLWLPLFLTGITAVFTAKGLVRISSVHMAMAIISSLALLASVASCLSDYRLRLRLTVGAAVVAAGAYTIGACYGDLKKARENITFLVQHPDCRTPSFGDRFTCYVIDQAHADAIRYVERMTTPTDYIFVGNGRHDKLVVNDVAFYFLTGRRSASKWYQFDPGLQTSSAIQREIVAELSNKCPHYIVLESQWDSLKEPNRSSASSGVTILDDYIRANFTPAATFGTVRVLRNIHCASS